MPSRRESQQRRVALGALGVGVGPIRQQSEMQIALGTRQMMDLEPLHQLRDVFPRGQHRRHGDDRAQRFRHAVAQRQPRQRDRADEQRDDCD